MLEIFTPPVEGEPQVRLPKPRALMFDEVREKQGGGFVLEAHIEKGFGPFKRVVEVDFMGGPWVARASARPLRGSGA